MAAFLLTFCDHTRNSVIIECRGKIVWARGLKNKTIRRMIADCFAFVRDRDEYMQDELKKGFSESMTINQ